MNEKRVIGVIVEGPSDESAIGGILKEYFSSEEVQFAVVHGDITSNYKTEIDNVVIGIEELIDGVRRRYGYNWDDFIRIIHISDTDGAFTNGCVVQADVENLQYYTDHIDARNPKEAEKRNKHKAEIMDKLFGTGKIHGIPYRLFFNSCNLEHVLYGQLKDFSDNEKDQMSDDFADEYEGKADKFIEFISDESFAVPGKYSDTCKFIKKERNSLKRYSNMHLIFDK